MNQIADKVKKGYLEAKAITKKYAKTFYFASKFIPKDKQLAAYSVYAICRISDESVDDLGQQGKDVRLKKIEQDINSVYSNSDLDDNLLLAFRETINRYEIPKKHFNQLAEGMKLDLNHNRFNNFQGLYKYCYKVAGVVGLIMLKIFGYTDCRAEKYAVDLGVAMQLTNILRDIKEDYGRGRIYLPEEELKKFSVSESDIATQELNDNFKELIKFQIKRARAYYDNSAAGIKLINNRASRFTVLAMKEIYSKILNAIEGNNYDVYSRRAQVNILNKLLITVILLLRRQK